MFKQLIANRLAEVDFDATSYVRDIVEYYDREIVRRDQELMSGEVTYHIDYGPLADRDAWFFLTRQFVKMMKEMGSTLDFDHFKHTLKFTFISLPPQHVLVPHTAAYIRAMCSINVPLRGTTKIDLYRDNIASPHQAGKHIIKHHYTSPIVLNVNQFHGVINDDEDTRLVLKVHMMVTPFQDVIDSLGGDKVKIFKTPLPWNKLRGSINELDSIS